jgi:E3 ubiquitin-protein ligase EDD1
MSPPRSRKSASSARKAPSANDLDPDMPEHDLEPPRFSRRALERLLYDWNALKAMIEMGQREETTNAGNGPVYEDQGRRNSPNFVQL